MGPDFHFQVKLQDKMNQTHLTIWRSQFASFVLSKPKQFTMSFCPQNLFDQANRTIDGKATNKNIPKVILRATG